ncbi:hypothetical protein NDJ14_16690 [Vibrio alginolyticus]|nr:hypothetical protein [Vibrio alginolyticus]MCR9325590.1 hypothetical protein [Vibrio alginolyticus]MCR9356131.1 hypothetical protein [Vibrio alginolyticus]MCR9519090.1 hypothetical protein [Vibrio alginolyticus]MCR9638312.1 hypothetical protein [Vibrio alginolyticus]
MNKVVCGGFSITLLTP